MWNAGDVNGDIPGPPSPWTTAENDRSKRGGGEWGEKRREAERQKVKEGRQRRDRREEGMNEEREKRGEERNVLEENKGESGESKGRAGGREGRRSSELCFGMKEFMSRHSES